MKKIRIALLGFTFVTLFVTNSFAQDRGVRGRDNRETRARSERNEIARNDKKFERNSDSTPNFEERSYKIGINLL